MVVSIKVGLWLLSTVTQNIGELGTICENPTCEKKSFYVRLRTMETSQENNRLVIVTLVAEVIIVVVVMVVAVVYVCVCGGGGGGRYTNLWKEG